MTQEFFGPLPLGGDLNQDDLVQWLDRQTVSFQKIITGTLQAGQELSSSNFVSGTTGWQIDGDGNAEFNGVTVRGDIVSGNWDGDDPADLSSGPDTSATAGFYLDSSAGAAQFTGSVFFQPPDESSEGSGNKFELGDGFFFRVYQDNPTAGEDTFWIGASTDATDHVKIGPTSSGNELKSIALGALSVDFDFGSWSHSLPKGVVYDWGYAEETAGDNVSTTKTTVLTTNASVPSGVSVSVLAWGFVSFLNDGGNSDRRFAYMDVGGTSSISSIASKGDSTGNNPSGHTHSMQSHTHSDGTLNTSTDSGHNHGVNNSTGGPSTASTGGESAVHAHIMGQKWDSLYPHFRRSFTPGGSTVSVNLRVNTESSTETFANKSLMYMVVVN